MGAENVDDGFPSALLNVSLERMKWVVRIRALQSVAVHLEFPFCHSEDIVRSAVESDDVAIASYFEMELRVRFFEKSGEVLECHTLNVKLSSYAIMSSSATT